eukprot:924108-Prymnesium_polylepis.1
MSWSDLLAKKTNVRPSSSIPPSSSSCRCHASWNDLSPSLPGRSGCTTLRTFVDPKTECATESP